MQCAEEKLSYYHVEVQNVYFFFSKQHGAMSVSFVLHIRSYCRWRSTNTSAMVVVIHWVSYTLE